MSACSVSASAGVRLDRQPLAEALDWGAEVWDDVVTRATSPSPFMSWAWHKAWAESAPEREVAGSEVLSLRRPDGSVQALLPLRLQRVRHRRIGVAALTWAIGDAGCPDDLDVPSLPGTDLSALAAELDATPWHVLILSNLTPDAPHAKALCAALAKYGHTTRRRSLWDCPELALPGSWEAYLTGLSASRRQLLRRKERALRRRHAVMLTDYAADRLDEGWSHLLALHEQRWAGGGAFRDPMAVRLQRRFAAEMLRQQRLWLTTLDVDGQPAAAWYGFVSDQTVYFYQGGRDPRWEHESVGLVLMGLMIQRAIERGFRRFNFLRGADPYKRQWTAVPRTTEELIVFRSGWRGRLLRVVDAAADLRRRLPRV